MFFYHGVNFYFQFVEVGSYTGWRGYSNDGRHFYTTTPDPNGPTAQAQRGDELIAINGTRLADDWSLMEFADRVPAGTPFSVTFQRDGQTYTIINRTIPYPPGKNPYQNSERLIYGLIWLLFLITGAVLILLKAELRQAWLLALMLGTFTGIMTDNYPYSGLGQTVVWIISLAKIAAFWFFPFFALFYLNFPERSKLLLKWPQLETFIYVTFYLLLLPFILRSRLPAHLRSSYFKLPLMGCNPNLSPSVRNS